LIKRNFDYKCEAFDDFLQAVQAFDQLNKSFSDRLKEIILRDKRTPWTVKELNELTGEENVILQL
tara:strand:+ start:365 stop:559 length:195 start_codon:yes stop_codon:yes gene_type:complete